MNNTMTVLVVDDEPLARQRLIRLLSNLPDYTVVAEAADGNAAIIQCQSLRPDIVLMDIRMPGCDGLKAAKSITAVSNPPAVIFCTAYAEHALEAFDSQAAAYLLKPVKKEKLQLALLQARKLNRLQLNALEGDESSVNVHEQRRHIHVNSHRGVELIAVDEIRYFQADQKYVSAYYDGGQVIIDDTLKELEQEFESLFARIHRNTLVAVNYIEALERAEEGRYRLRLAGVAEQPIVSRRHVGDIKKLLQRL